MARRNGKGPDEKGPRTGRGLGNCNPNQDNNNENKTRRGGRGPGNGNGHHGRPPLGGRGRNRQ